MNSHGYDDGAIASCHVDSHFDWSLGNDIGRYAHAAELKLYRRRASAANDRHRHEKSQGRVRESKPVSIIIEGELLVKKEKAA